MDRHHWIVSDPPHREADLVDLDETSRLLGLGKAEARIKVHFWAPEVWLAYPDDEQASAAAADLQAAGLKVLVVPAKNLLTVPAPTPVLSFVFTDDQLVAQTEDGEVHLRYDVPVIGSFCRPPADFLSGDSAPRPARVSTRSATGLRTSSSFLDGLVNLGRSQSQRDTVEMLERKTNLDLYFPNGAEVRRISIAQGVADFSGIGEAKRHQASGNMDLCVAECERRFADLMLDKRLVNVRPRRRLTVGGPVEGQENRMLFSFGTVGLQALLESLSPDFGHITQFELGSRIAYLMRRGDHPDWAKEE